MRTLRGIAGDFVGMLDWMLPVALLAGLAGATYGAAFMHAGRWSLGALLFGSRGAFDGAMLAGIGWASWSMTRRHNLLLGILAGMGIGLAMHAAAHALFRTIANLILRVPDPVLDTMQHAWNEWLVQVSGISYNVLLVTLLFGLPARLRRRETQGAEHNQMGAATTSR